MKGSHKFRHVLAYFYGTPWAIHPVKLAEIQAALWRRIGGELTPAENVQLEQIELRLTRDSPGAFEDYSPLSPKPVKQDAGYTLVGNVGVIRIAGTITPRASVFDEWSGGTSHEQIGRATEAALADGKVESIVYDIDSGGGVVFGMMEGAAKVAAAKKTKPTTAVSNFVAASAAYWYAAQASEVVVAPSGQVGCIGVLMANTDQTKMHEMMGVRYDLVSNDSSPFKSEGWPQVPVTPESLAAMKEECNKYAAEFVSAIAKGRGVKANKVNSDFGKGRMLLAADALEAGMVDRVDTMESVLSKLHKANSKGARRNVAAQLAKLRLPLT